MGGWRRPVPTVGVESRSLEAEQVAFVTAIRDSTMIAASHTVHGAPGVDSTVTDTHLIGGPVAGPVTRINVTVESGTVFADRYP